MPPRPGPPPRQVPRRRILVRRLLALAALLVAALIVASIVLATHHSGSSASPTTTVIPPPKPFRIIFPEGFTRRDMAHRVAVVAKIAEGKSHKHVQLTSRGYLHWSEPRAIGGVFGSKKRRLEGFLFPATYDFLRNTTSRQLVQDQLRAFATNWHKVDLRYARKKNLTPYDVLIIASMVEREALAPDERPLIAAVIYNRLHAQMPLGIDATIRYGLNIPGTEPLHESQLASDNPYNTRKFAGLTPTPIGNPGLASMQAAAHPAHVDYLYFVRKPDKVHHYFTASFQDFVNHEIAYGYK
jgi:peptidoglycan lytic transglycosylase G